MKVNYLFKYILIVLFIVGVNSSCKDYLEVKPVSSFGPDYIFSNVANATKALYGAYSSLCGDNGYGIRISMYYPYDNDEMMGPDGNLDDGERRAIAHYGPQPGNRELLAPFNQLYDGIEKVNICIYYIPRMDKYNNGTDSEKAELHRLYGEALTLRAQLYFELVRNWGDVPAQFLPSSFVTDLFQEKMDRDAIYDKLIADLEEAAPLVPWQNESSVKNDRISQGAVRALRARLALFRGGFSLRRNPVEMRRSQDYEKYYQIASDECRTIIQKGAHKLNPSFEAVFKDALDAHKMEANLEVLWEIGMIDLNGKTSVNSKLGYYNGPKWNGKGNRSLYILPTFFYSFDSLDKRRDVTCVVYDLNEDATLDAQPLSKMTDGKFRRDWIKNPDALKSDKQHFGVNWPVVRYSDVLLMFAEAENELKGGPTGEAIAAFEEVRTRGFGGNKSLIGITPTDKAGFFNALIKERSFELAGEGIRKYDLIRWNMLGTKLTETQEKLAAMSARTPPYDNLPAKMYFKQSSSSVVWYNSLYKPSPNAPTGDVYKAIDWVGSKIEADILPYYAKRFTAGKSELFPLPTSVIDDSRGKLQQDNGY